MNGSMVPANAKKSLLIMGFLRPMPDTLILGVGVAISVLALAFSTSAPTWLLLVECIPMFVSAILVAPIPHYHNTLCAIQSILRFYNERRNYIWRGWCVYDEFKDNK